MISIFLYAVIIMDRCCSKCCEMCVSTFVFHFVILCISALFLFLWARFDLYDDVTFLWCKTDNGGQNGKWRMCRRRQNAVCVAPYSYCVCLCVSLCEVVCLWLTICACSSFLLFVCLWLWLSLSESLSLSLCGCVFLGVVESGSPISLVLLVHWSTGPPA